MTLMKVLLEYTANTQTLSEDELELFFFAMQYIEKIGAFVKKSVDLLEQCTKISLAERVKYIQDNIKK